MSACSCVGRVWLASAACTSASHTSVLAECSEVHVCEVQRGSSGRVCEGGVHSDACTDEQLWWVCRYQRYADLKGWKVQRMNENIMEGGGYKECVLQVLQSAAAHIARQHAASLHPSCPWTGLASVSYMLRQSQESVLVCR